MSPNTRFAKISGIPNANFSQAVSPAASRKTITATEL
jgi:hypothetical protein